MHSEPGKGTTFSIYLPALTDAPASEEMPEPTLTPSVHASGTVLVVEDDDEVRGLVRTVLESDGFRVLEAPERPDSPDACAQLLRRRLTS